MSGLPNLSMPRTTLRRPYEAAGGRLVAQEEGIRGLSETIYVDQINGLNANNGRTWAGAKQTVFGATGAMSVMADGDTMVIRAGHNEALAGPPNITLNFIKVLVEGTREQTSLTGLGVRVFFSGFGTTISGDANEFYDLLLEGCILSGDNNYFFNCVSEVPPWAISGNANFLRKCHGIINTLSGNLNWIVEHGNSPMTLAATATQNIVISPRTYATTPITCAAGSTSNLFIDIDIGTNSWQVADLGANFVYARSRSSTGLVEALFPVIPTAAPLAIGGAGAGIFGAAAVIMAAGLAPAFDYEFLGIVTILNMVDDYRIQAQDTTGAVLAEFTLNCSVIGTRFNEKMSTPVRVRAGVGIQVLIATTGGGADTANVRIKYRV